MNVSLTPQLETLIEDKLKSGMYKNAAEVIREGLRLLAERDDLHQARLTALRSGIQLGLEQGARGETVSGADVEARILGSLDGPGPAE